MKKVISIEDVKKSMRDVPDFPKPGILFKDITTALKSTEIYNFIIDELYNYYKDKGITKIVGIESRGFIFGSALAYKLNAGFIPIRKPGKLPADVYSKSYSLEYGTDSIEIHKDALSSDDVVLLHDDLLATGGTISAAIDLIQLFNVENIYVNFVCELSFLNGREKINPNFETYSLVHF